VKHIYLVADTEEPMSSMDLREMAKTKIKCARESFSGMKGVSPRRTSSTTWLTASGSRWKWRRRSCWLIFGNPLSPYPGQKVRGFWDETGFETVFRDWHLQRKSGAQSKKPRM